MGKSPSRVAKLRLNNNESRQRKAGVSGCHGTEHPLGTQSPDS